MSAENSLKLDTQKELTWEDGQDTLKSRILKFPTTVSFPGQLVLAILEEQDGQTMEEIFAWFEDLSYMDDYARTELMGELIDENVVRQEDDRYYIINRMLPKGLKRPESEDDDDELLDEPEELIDPAEKGRVKMTAHNYLWNLSCPILVKDYTIYTSGEEDRVSFTIMNLSEKEIRSAYLQVEVYDDTSDIITTIRCVYQQMHIKPGEYLPTEKTFSLKTDYAYRVKVRCEKVAFADNEVWRLLPRNKACTLQDQTMLTVHNFARFKYLNSSYVSLTKRKPSIYYMVKSFDSFWQCICGTPVAKGANCPLCKLSEPEIYSLLSRSFLEKVQKNAVYSRAQESAEPLWNMYEEAANEIYDQGCRMKELNIKESLQMAEKTFDQIIDWRDARMLREECQKQLEQIDDDAYLNGLKLLNDQKYPEAINAFEYMQDYGDSKQLLSRAHYEYGEKLMKQYRFDEAIHQLELGKDYKDSSELQEQILRYQKGLDLMEAAQYNEAADTFLECSIVDSENKVSQCQQIIQRKKRKKRSAVVLTILVIAAILIAGAVLADYMGWIQLF